MRAEDEDAVLMGAITAALVAGTVAGAAPGEQAEISAMFARLDRAEASDGRTLRAFGDASAAPRRAMRVAEQTKPMKSQSEIADENNERLNAIAGSLIRSRALANIDWVDLSVVFEMDDDGSVSSNYGYAYAANGAYTAVAFSHREVDGAVAAYREWLRLEGDKGFAKMLLQFNRGTRRVKAQFEFEDDARWKITPANVDEMIEALRPRWD